MYDGNGLGWHGNGMGCDRAEWAGADWATEANSPRRGTKDVILQFWPVSQKAENSAFWLNVSAKKLKIQLFG